MANEKTIERTSLLDLQEMAKTARKLKIPIIIIGGYAVEAYTEGYRYTKDIDFITLRTGLNKLIPLLKNLGYQHQKTQFGISGIKKINDGFIDLHISVDKVYDVSTDSSYPVSKNCIKKAKICKINGYYEENRNLNVSVSVISIEELLILKLMTRGREKDITDIVSLLTDKMQEIKVSQIADCCRKAGLEEHITSRSREFIIDIRNGEVKKIWENLTGRRLAWKTEQEMAKFLKKLLDFLKKS